jgi:hypothetical protein
MATRSSVSKKKTASKPTKSDKHPTAKPEQIAPNAIDPYLNFNPAPVPPPPKKKS